MPFATSPPLMTQLSASFSPGSNTQQMNLNAIPPIVPAPTPTAILAALPPPQTFDFIPQIHALIARLLLDPADKNALQPKDLPGEVALIKKQIAAARAVVSSIPDIGRTVEEQETEIEAVKAKIERLKSKIEGLGGDCHEQRTEMQGSG